VIPDQTVTIENGRIVSIRSGAGGPVPRNARVVDGSGKYLMPGLAEMHAHVPGSGQPEAYRNDVLFLYVSRGVTLIRGMQGDPIHLELREKLSRGELLGPRLITAGPSFSGGRLQTPEQGVAQVQEQVAAGYDFLKIAGNLSPETFDAVAEAAKAAGIPFAGHVGPRVDLERALNAGYASIDHFDMYMEALVDPEIVASRQGGLFGYALAPYANEERIPEIARRTREAGVWVVPTETIMHSALVVDIDNPRGDFPEFRYMPGEVVGNWINSVRNRRANPNHSQEAAEACIRIRLQLIKALHDAGAGLLLGSDAPQWFNVPGFSLHREMEVMAQAGLTPYEVLRTGTVHPAIYFGEEATSGQVAEGMRADLILLDANPLEDLANAGRIAGVIRDGRWLAREEIERRLAEIARRRGG
jgi:imidazolonepropionase-like amidohydrolase